MTPVTMGEPLSFENLGCGAAQEKFEEALSKVLADIMDPNTPPRAVREINLKMTIKPSEDRTSGDVEIFCNAKLAPDKPFPTRIFIGQDVSGNPEAHEINSGQLDLFPKAKGNVTSMSAGAEKGD